MNKYDAQNEAYRGVVFAIASEKSVVPLLICLFYFVLLH